MIVLTRDYQLISTIYLQYGEIRTYAKYRSQDTINNYTAYVAKSIYHVYDKSGFVSVSRATATLNSDSRNYGYTTFNKGDTELLKIERTMTHNQDGSSLTKNIRTTWNASFGGSGDTNVDIQMPKIKRLPNITNATDFTDESNPTLNFINYANFSIKPSLKFYSNTDRQKVLLELKRNENVTSPYTWNITSAERENIRKTLNNDKEYIVSECLSAYDNTTHIGDTCVDRKLNFVNAEPVVSLKLTETNQKVIDIYKTNSAGTIIKNISKLTLSSTQTLKKYATLKSKTYNFNNSDVAGETISNVVPTSNRFTVKITDSRNYSSTKTITPKMENYIPVSINTFSFERADATSSDIVLNASITYYQHTYNGVANKPTITYKIGESGTVFKLDSSQYDLNTNTNTITIQGLTLLDVLPYTDSKRFFLGIDDIFSSDKENEVVSKGVPTMELGEFDVQVNGNLYIANKDGQNIRSIIDICHPVGSYYETSDISFNPNKYWGGTWVLENDGTVLVSKKETVGSAFYKTLGSIVGEEKHTQTIDEMPSHTHNKQGMNKISRGLIADRVAVGSSSSAEFVNVPFENTGGGKPFNVVQPSKIVNRWHRTA